MAVQSLAARAQSSALTGQLLVDRLHDLIDRAKYRLWIASPYIGAWGDVGKILGSGWKKVDVRLLVDIDSGFLSRYTLQKFEAHRPVRSLSGLHAKLYVVDDSVLLTSANLTGCAFQKRHEAGLVLEGPAAAHFVTLYETWWQRSKDIAAEHIPVPRRRQGTGGDEPNGSGLPDLWTLPKSPEPDNKAPGVFSDYQHFLTEYKMLAELYVLCGKRYYPAMPKYFEVDALLDFLYHSGDKPSQAFKTMPARDLTDSERARAVAEARARFRKSGEYDGDFHAARARTVRRLLNRRKIPRLSRPEVDDLAKSLNCFSTHGLAQHNFVTKNELRAVRKALYQLIHGEGSAVYRMENCKAALHGFGRSAIQETMGYYFPNDFPLRNQNVNAGLRFFGYKVSAK